MNLEIIDDQGCVTELLEPGSALQGKEFEGFSLRVREIVFCGEKWLDRDRFR